MKITTLLLLGGLLHFITLSLIVWLAMRFFCRVKKNKQYALEHETALNNGDYIKITYLPSCKNVAKGTPNPYIGMQGTVVGLKGGKFSLLTPNGSWLTNIDESKVQYEYVLGNLSEEEIKERNMLKQLQSSKIRFFSQEEFDRLQELNKKMFYPSNPQHIVEGDPCPITEIRRSVSISKCDGCRFHYGTNEEEMLMCIDCENASNYQKQ